MQQHQQDGITWFQFDTLPSDRVQHGVFGRQGGVSSAPLDSLNLSNSVKDDPASVAENRNRAYGVFGRTQNTLVHAALIHDNHVERVSSADYGAWKPGCDALITNEPGCGLTMNYADCGSVFLYDKVHHAIGLGHAGWRGAIANVPAAMIAAMHDAFGTEPEHLIAALGPCISVSHYEVDEPVISEVKRRYPKWEDRLFAWHYDDDGQPIGRPHFNLTLANHINLYEAGVKTVEFSNLCTASRTDLFYSHRAEKGKTGRFGAVMILS